MIPAEGILQELPEETRKLLRKFVAEAGRLFGETLDGVILYGSAARGEYVAGRSNVNLLLLLITHDMAALDRYAKIHRRWQKEGFVVPLFLTEAELRASALAFPLELGEIQDAHVLLKGRDPFEQLQVDQRYLQLACEQEIRSNLLRLRQRYVEGGGTAETAVLLMPLSLTALLPALRGLGRLLGGRQQIKTEAFLAGLSSMLGVNLAVLQEVWNLKRGLISPGAVEVPRFFARYVDGLESLAQRLEQLEVPTPK